VYLPKYNLRTKLSILFITLAILPLIALNIIWFYSFKTQFLETASQSISNISQGTVAYINNYFSAEILSLIIHSQTQSVIKGDAIEATPEMQAFLLQNKDIQELQLLNKSGFEILHVTRDKVYSQTELTDQSENLPYKLTTYVGGNRYVSPVSYEKDGTPVITIAVPVVLPQASQSLQDLNTSALGRSRKPGEIFGILIEKISIASLWNYLSELHIGKSGYVFVVDNKGRVINHPNKSYAIQRKSLLNMPEVNNFVKSENLEVSHSQPVLQTKNEYGYDTLMQSKPIITVNWGLFAEEPLSDTDTQVWSAGGLIILLFITTLITVAIISILVSSRITNPIEALRVGSRYIGGGNFDYRLSINSGDEIEDLANSFNAMSKSLQDAFSHLERDKNVLAVEGNKMSLTLSSINDAVIGVDSQKRIIVFNKAAEILSGQKEVNVKGTKITDLFTVYRKEAFDKFLVIPGEIYCPAPKDQSEGIVFKEKNLKVVFPNERQAFINLEAGQIKNKLSVDLGCILTIHDVSAEQELEDMKLDFVSVTAHELRTPLTSIRGYLSILVEEGIDKLSNDQKQFISRIKISTEQLIALVENILNVSRIERGVLSMNFKSENWTNVVKEVIDNLQDKAETQNVSVNFVEPPTPLPQVLVDKFRISQVLVNLISNGINYTQPGGKVEILIENKNHEIITHIKDNGEGIPKEALPKLFTKFFRVSGILEQGSKGTGLGLYISKSIVDSHKGKIWVTSELGKGSIFSFSLPCV